MHDPTGRITISNLLQVGMGQATFTIKNNTNSKYEAIIYPGSINKPLDTSLQETVVLDQMTVNL
jgi:hypothetical protein